VRGLAKCAAALILMWFNPLNAGAQQVHAAQDELSDANVTVRVLGPDSRPLGKQAFVTLYQQGSSMPLGTVITSVSSTAVLTGMPSYGPYTVEVKCPGYATARKDFQYNQASGRVEVDVTMQVLGDTSSAGPPPRDPKVQEHVDKGMQAMDARKFADAQKEFSAAHKAAPRDAEVCYLLGAAYQKSGDLHNAQKYLENAISIDPDNVSALVALGQLHDQQKDYRAAIPPLEKAVVIDSKEWLAHWVLSDAYLRTGEYEKARKNAAAAVELGNGSANKAELIEGEALAALGRPDDAIKALEDFLHNLPNDPAAPAVRAFIAKLQSASAVSHKVGTN
jgi:regulator of sirC expression with transglutaminase-like and TPR domain